MVGRSEMFSYWRRSALMADLAERMVADARGRGTFSALSPSLLPGVHSHAPFFRGFRDFFAEIFHDRLFVGHELRNFGETSECDLVASSIVTVSMDDAR